MALSHAHYHVFIPGLFAPLKLWQQDFAFVPESPALLALLADYEVQSWPVSGLERGLLHYLHLMMRGEPPAWAGLRHAFESGGMYRPPLLCADPVHLETGNNALVVQATPLNLSRADTELLLVDLNQHLALDGLVLTAFHPQRWYLHALDDSFTTALPQTTPLSEVGSGNIFPQLPQSTDKYWHQLMNELQMLLHNHRINQAREQRGQPPVNGIWLWGEAAADSGAAPLAECVAPTLSPDEVQSVQGGALSGQVIAAALQIQWQPQVDTELAAVSTAGDRLVILDQLQHAVAADQPQLWQQALSELDDYFDFLRAVLQTGAQVSLYDANGQILYCQRVARWQFWRRARADWQEFIA